jgi:hypothetical protein
MDSSKAIELANVYLKSHTIGHSDYEWTITDPQDIGDKWYFDFTFKHKGELPEDQWESLLGAPGFSVDKNTGVVETVSWEEYQKFREVKQ